LNWHLLIHFANILKQEIEKVKGVSRKVEDRLQSELSQLKTDLEKQSSIQTDLEKRLSEKEMELDEAVTSSKEAIAKANEIEKLSQDKLTDINKQLDFALSAKLELEAKVESTSDEMRSLLERCLGAESELDRSRSSLIELRRKLDDSQAALHELGRENQSIQVDLAKQSGRKWADDNEVNNCYACQSAFSITNRKHHCRNCGQIFCADCSGKQAMMPNYKKPQRVCEPCFGELQQGK
jgi:early endosome antigen 1